MAIFNSNKVKKLGKYATVTMTIGAFMNAIKANKVWIPKEQRKMENEGIEYRKKRDSFIANILYHAFSETPVDKTMEKKITDVFGKDITFAQSVPQIAGISIDEDGNVYISDGQHRFLHYLKDFLYGGHKLWNNPDTDFGNDFVNAAMQNIFDAVELEDGEGNSDNHKYISVDTLTDDDLQKILDIKVIAAVVDAIDEEERAHLFISMNSCTPIKQSDLDKASYCRYNMWQSIASVKESLDSIDCRKHEGVTFESKRKYNANDARILKTLFNAQMGTIVPLVAHAGLLTYLSAEQKCNYQWMYESKQTQAEQVRNFFKATANMSRKECDQLLNKMMDDVVKIGHKIYDNEFGMMQQAKGLKSLLVGQMHAMNNCDIDENEFFEISAIIVDALLIEHQYTPVCDNRQYTASYFNNAHKDRRKNEKFMQWVVDENAEKVGA